MTRYDPPPRSWARKFADAVRGLLQGVRGQSSFLVHVPCAALVVVCGVWLRVGRAEWCWLAACIAAVLAAELFNSAVERLAKAVDTRENEHLAAALNISSAAVLVAAIGAAVIGAIILGPKLVMLLTGSPNGG